MRRRSSSPLLPTVLVHVVITLLSLGIAASLPTIAQYILFTWWPRAQQNSPLLFATEIAFASLLISLFIGIRSVIASRHIVLSARLASLVHAKNGPTRNPIAHWRERALVRSLPASRDLSVLCITGKEMFGSDCGPIGSILQSAFELRVLLLDPDSSGAHLVARARPGIINAAAAIRQEVEVSIAYLNELRTAGKKVALRFYGFAPFWRLAIHGGHVWVRYCHPGWINDGAPEYVFELHPNDPKRGLFVPFHMYFLNQWNNPLHPEFDFDRNQLIYRDADGGELTRRPFVRGNLRRSAA